MNRQFGGQSMVSALRRVLVFPPSSAGWDDKERAGAWRELGFLHAPDSHTAELQHRQMVARMEESGCQVLSLEGSGLSMDAVYAHDASLVTDLGAICLRMGKPSRCVEPVAHAAWYAAAAIPVLGEIRPPGTVEAGDALWLSERILLVGRGYRTNAEGINQLTSLLGPYGIEVIAAPLPHGAGPQTCLHLMSLISLLDDRTALADPSWLAVETMELLERLDFSLIEIDQGERDTLACNVLSLGGGRLLALEENQRTNAALRREGFHVSTFSGSELGINGGGGPTCLTRPVLREN
jgi:N-dimethylarginine dimethylaminohydrolase